MNHTEKLATVLFVKEAGPRIDKLLAFLQRGGGALKRKEAWGRFGEGVTNAPRNIYRSTMNQATNATSPLLESKGLAGQIGEALGIGGMSTGLLAGAYKGGKSLRKDKQK